MNRRRFIPVAYLFVIACLFGFAALLIQDVRTGGGLIGTDAQTGLSRTVGYTFYVWLTVINLFTTSVFWGLHGGHLRRRPGQEAVRLRRDRGHAGRAGGRHRDQPDQRHDRDAVSAGRADAARRRVLRAGDRGDARSGPHGDCVGRVAAGGGGGGCAAGGRGRRGGIGNGNDAGARRDRGHLLGGSPGGRHVALLARGRALGGLHGRCQHHDLLHPGEHHPERLGHLQPGWWAASRSSTGWRRPPRSSRRCSSPPT